MNYYSDYTFVRGVLSNMTTMVSINMIFLSVKIFDYFNKSKQMSMISNTLYRAREDTLYFILIFVILMLGFVGMGFIYFGRQLPAYNSVSAAFMTCFQITIGVFDYNSIYA